MPLLDTLKSWVIAQPAPVTAETKGAVPTVNIVPTVNYPNYQVLNVANYNPRAQPASNPVFLSILGRIQAAARVVDWKAVWVKADGTEAPSPVSTLTRTLTRPNPEQTWSGFVNQYLTQLLQHGNVFIHCETVLAPSTNAGQLQQLRVMPSNTEIVGGQGWRQPVVGYRLLLLSGGYDTFTPDEVVHVKKWQLRDNDPYGVSPILAAALQLQNLSEATHQRLKQMAAGGPSVVAFNMDPTAEGLDGEQAAAFARRINGPEKFTYVNGQIGTTQVGLSPVQLDIINSVKLDAGMIADVLQFPAQLLSTSDGNTFSNVGEANKSLYADCVLPLLWELEDALNHKLADTKYRARIDTSGVESLKPNLAPLVKALDNANFLTTHQKLRLTGQDPIPGSKDGYVLAKGAVAVDLDFNPLGPPPASVLPAAPAALGASPGKTGGNAPANPA
jgi:HK97 family phage portal protein